MELKIFNHEEGFIKDSVNLIASICKEPSHGGKTIKIAFSGGSTPAKIYRSLAVESTLPFSELEVYQVDERYVPFDHPESNYKLIQNNFISLIPKNIKGFHAFDTSLPLEECLEKYEQELQKYAPLFFDIAVLGIGADGHTASLFPYSPALQEKKHLVAHTETDQFAIKDRLTFTFPPLLESKNLLVLLKGPEKLPIVEKLADKSFQDIARVEIEKFPGLSLLQHPHLTVYYLK